MGLATSVNPFKKIPQGMAIGQPHLDSFPPGHLWGFYVVSRCRSKVTIPMVSVLHCRVCVKGCGVHVRVSKYSALEGEVQRDSLH